MEIIFTVIWMIAIIFAIRFGTKAVKKDMTGVFSKQGTYPSAQRTPVIQKTPVSKKSPRKQDYAITDGDWLSAQLQYERSVAGMSDMEKLKREHETHCDAGLLKREHESQCQVRPYGQ